METLANILGKSLERVSGECSQHGDFTTYRVTGSEAVCPTCVDQKSRQDDIERTHHRRVEQLLGACRVPTRFATAGFKNFTVTQPAQGDAKQVIQRYLREFSATTWRPLAISGPVGTGKTHLVCALANNLISKCVSVRYATAHTMLADIKRAYSTDGMTEASQIAHYVNDFDLLILDEVDVMRGTDNDLGLIFAVINGRYNACKPVATISNQAVATLADFVGERTVSRLAENATVIVCDWQDQRTRKDNGL